MGLIFGLCEITIRLFQTFFVVKLLPAYIHLPTIKVDVPCFGKCCTMEAIHYVHTGNMIIYKSSDIIIGIFLSTKDITRYYVASAGMLMLGTFIEAFAAAIKQPSAISMQEIKNIRSAKYPF